MPEEFNINEILGIRRRKYRLDHLTATEKVERKKLKNRVAAQTSRDRKKLRMESMEITIKNLTDENDELQKRNNFLEDRLRELESRLRGSRDNESVTDSGNVQEKVMALNLLVILTISVTVWLTLQKSLMEFTCHHQIPLEKAKAPKRFPPHLLITVHQ
ncbi:hypothetical protein DMENIID0001_021350 [Sergentomyia squamirostris]